MTTAANTFNSTISFVNKVTKQGTCTGCGLCVGLDTTGSAYMADSPKGPVPHLGPASEIPSIIYTACAGHRLDYPGTYMQHYGSYPENWLTGITKGVYTGYSLNAETRRNSSSGGILTQVLVYLLESKKIDGAILVKQGMPAPEKARVFIARTAAEIKSASQSIYIPVSTLDILPELQTGKKYAITCLPEQSAAIRILQAGGHEKAATLKYILGPYTGTALYPKAIDIFRKTKNIRKTDSTASLKWRAGEWPGYLELITEKGRVVRSPKIYYNFLIPFFITNASLQSMDFANEFADLAVGDAWSPEFEKQGQGFSVVVSRTAAMNSILQEMQAMDLIALNMESDDTAGSMHGHMIDFKKRGSYIRNRMRRTLGMAAPDFGYKPASVQISRVLVEMVISGIFILGRTWFFRMFLFLVPERILGPLFNSMRLGWKKISKPVKRKGLSNYNVSIG